MANILEALQNAEYNLKNNIFVTGVSKVIFEMAKSQLHNAIVLLDKGYSITTEIEPLLIEYDDDIEKVPIKEDHARD